MPPGRERNWTRAGKPLPASPILRGLGGSGWVYVTPRGSGWRFEQRQLDTHSELWVRADGQVGTLWRQWGSDPPFRTLTIGGKPSR